MTGAVASQRVTEVREGLLAPVGNRRTSVKAQGGLTARVTIRAGAKAGLSDLMVLSVTSWGWSRSQGFGCSPIKVVRELGSERRETVRSLSVMGDGSLRGAAFSTRGPKWTNLWFTSYPAKGKCWVSKSGRDNR